MKDKRYLRSGLLTAGLHLLLLMILRQSVYWLTACGVFAVMLLTFVMFSGNVRLFSQKYSRIADFAGSYLPAVCLTVLLIAFDTGIYFLLRQRLGGITAVWLAVSITLLTLCTLVIFVIGAARTMLFRDEK